jgi:hypothetical protein
MNSWNLFAMRNFFVDYCDFAILAGEMLRQAAWSALADFSVHQTNSATKLAAVDRIVAGDSALRITPMS